MSKRDRLRRKLKNNPKSATRQELETLLLNYGFVLDRIKGSHHIYLYENQDVTERLVLPFHGQKIKTFYVALTIQILDRLFPNEDLTGDDNA